jgi:hypothetical protein
MKKPKKVILRMLFKAQKFCWANDFGSETNTSSQRPIPPAMKTVWAEEF